MFSGLIALALKVLGIFFPDKDERDVAHDDGKAEGIAQQKTVDQSSVIKDVTDAKNASNSVDASVSSGVPIDTSDGFRRD